MLYWISLAVASWIRVFCCSQTSSNPVSMGTASLFMTTNPLFLCNYGVESIWDFRFDRRASLDQLLDKVRRRHYSTFSLYDDQQLQVCLKEFEKTIIRHFADPKQIEWIDENIMIVLRLFRSDRYNQ